MLAELDIDEHNVEPDAATLMTEISSSSKIAETVAAVVASMLMTFEAVLTM